MGVGCTILLFAPLLLLTEWLLGRLLRLDRRVTQSEREVGQTQLEVAEVAGRQPTTGGHEEIPGADEAAPEPPPAGPRRRGVSVEYSSARLEPSSPADELDREVRDALFQDYRDTRDLFTSLKVARSPAPFAKALRLAIDAGLVTDVGPRVELQFSSLHLRFLPVGDDSVELILETDTGRELGTVDWAAGEDIGDALRQVSELAKVQPGFDGMDKFFPGHAREHLADTLLYALAHGEEVTGRRDISKVIEITPEGWIITERGLRPKSVPFYLVSFDDRAPIEWDEHIRNKGWDESPSFPYTFAWAQQLHDHRSTTP